MHRQHLKNVYDCINRIAQKHEQKGVDRSNWFYSKEELTHIKNDNRNVFL